MLTKVVIAVLAIAIWVVLLHCPRRQGKHCYIKGHINYFIVNMAIRLIFICKYALSSEKILVTVSTDVLAMAIWVLLLLH